MMRRLLHVPARGVRFLQLAFFPTERQKAVRCYRAAGGDKALRFGYDLTPASFVMDVGGYQGQWSSDLYSRYRCRIVIFEPVSEFAEEILERFSANPDIRVCGFGLGGSSRRETISVCGDSSSVFRKSSDRRPIEIIDIIEWLEREGISEVALIKINIEGGEYELLERLIDTGYIRIFQNVQVQFHRIAEDSDHRMACIHDGLAQTHSPTYQYRFVWENWMRR